MQEANSLPQGYKSLSATSRTRVLVVDDDSDIRVAIRAVLETAGYEVSVARDGIHALQQLGVDPEKPSIVILDIAMPGLDGIEMMEALGGFTSQDKPEVIILSAYLSEASSKRAAELGACALLSKPLLPEQLLQVLRRCIARRESRTHSTNS